MDEALERALRASLVQVRGGPGGSISGTGFFVGLGLVVTCRHVVAGAPTAQLVRHGENKVAEVQELGLRCTADLALLKTGMACTAHARLGIRAATRDAVLAIGFPVRDGSAHEEEIVGTIEDLLFQHPIEPWKSGARLVKFKEGQVHPGLSGSPLVNERTQRVVGIVSASRDLSSALGGLAVPASLLLDAGSAVAVAQQAIDWSHSVWRDVAGSEGPFLDHYLDSAMPFFGREPVLALLDEWAARGPQRCLLVARAGMGKSSVLARWYEQQRKAFAAAGGHDRLALVPISIRLDHARAEQVLASLAHAVGELRGHAATGGGSAGSNGVREYIRDGLSAPAPDGRKLVLVIDGLDETVGWTFGEAILPKVLGRGVHVLLAARRLADADLPQWRQRVGWTASEPVQEIGLDPLEAAHLVAACRQWWGLDEAAAADYGRWLFAVTAGDPLVVGLRLQIAGPQAPDRNDLAAGESALDGLFRDWWAQQEVQWGKSELEALGSVGAHVLNVLSAAFEPLSRAGLLAILKRLGPYSGAQLDAALRLLGRFVIASNAAYMIGHPEVARWRWRRLCADRESGEVDAAILAWARSSLCDGDAEQSVEVDPYIVRCLSRHLQRLGSASGADVELLVGRAWRARHQGQDGWPADYLADLDVAEQLCDGLDRPVQGQEFPALGYRAEIQLRRQSTTRLTARVSAGMAAQLRGHGLWTSNRTLRHVLASYSGEYPRVAAVGAIAAGLALPELVAAMDALALQRAHEFGMDASLGTWKLAAAAGRCPELGHEFIVRWAVNLPGMGAPAALLGLALQCAGARRQDLLKRGWSLLRHHTEATDEALLALGKRVGDAFRLEEVAKAVGTAATPFMVASRLAFHTSDRPCAAAALRIAWKWLDRDSRVSAMASLIASIEEQLTAGSHVDNWCLAVGAVADVCTVADARRLFRLLHNGVVSDRTSSLHRDRTLYVAMLQFAARLRVGERRVPDLPAEVVAVAFRGGSFAPHTRALFRSAAALAEWRGRLAESVHEMRLHDEHDAVMVLELIAEALPADLLDLQWNAIGLFSTGLRDRATCAVLAAMACQGESQARVALQRADSPDHGVEHHVLCAMIDALQGRRDADNRLSARRSLSSFSSTRGLRARLMSVLARPLGPWRMSDVELWVADGSGDRQRALSFLLPHIDIDELVDPETPYRLRIDPQHADLSSVETTLRRIASVHTVDQALGWAQSMADAIQDSRGRWATLAVCALSPLLDEQQHTRFTTLAESIPDSRHRAEACAALLARSHDGPVPDRLWKHIESELSEATHYQAGRRVAAILRRLYGGDLDRAMNVARLDTQLLARAAFSLSSLWVDCAQHLMRWASWQRIEADFVPGGRLIELGSGSDSEALRSALAPRLLELGQVDLAMRFAASMGHAPEVHARMVLLVADRRQAESLVQTIDPGSWGHTSVLAVAQQLADAGDSVANSIRHAVCLGLLRLAQSDAELRLFLAATGPLLNSLSKGTRIARLRDAVVSAANAPDCRAP